MKFSRQAGSAHVVIIAVLIVAIIGALSFVLWQNVINKQDTQDTNKSLDTSDSKVASEPKVAEPTDNKLYIVDIKGIQAKEDLTKLPDSTPESFKQYLSGVLSTNTWKSVGTDEMGNEILVRDEYNFDTLSATKISGGIKPVGKNGETYPGGAPYAWILQNGSWSRTNVQ